MDEFFKNLISQITNIWNNTSLIQKLIIGGILLAFVIALILLLTMNASRAGYPLYNKKLDLQQRAEIKKALDDLNIKYDYDNGRFLLKNKKTADEAQMLLVEKGVIPDGVKAFDIFDINEITTSEFMNNIKVRRALMGQIEKLLESSPSIEEAVVSIAMPKSEVFIDMDNPVTCSVMITPAYGAELSRAHMKGYMKLIQLGVDKLKEENIIITDNLGNILNDFSDEGIMNDFTTIEKQISFKRKIIDQYRSKIVALLAKSFSDDRYSVDVDVDINFDKEESEIRDIRPIIKKEDNPLTPYDDSEIVLSVDESKKVVNEKFKGPGLIPEGPPGVDPNVPPGYEGAFDQNTEYTRDENIVNSDYGEKKTIQNRAPWRISRISATVLLDGIWTFVYDEKSRKIKEKIDGGLDRTFEFVKDDVVKQYEDAVRKAIGYDVKRFDQVTVKSVQFDRTKQFALEDDKYKRKKQLTQTLLALIVALVVILISFIIYRILAREMARRRRLKEEELARQHQAMRESALRSAEEEGVEVELSVEEKARLEMQENAINMAREHPEDVAQLIRTWLAEE